MRKQLFKTVLHFANGVKLPITVACGDGERLPDLIEKHRTLYERTQGMASKTTLVGLTNFTVDTVHPTIHMTDEQYDEEISFCDIVED